MNPKRVWLIPTLICVLSSALIVIIFLNACPGILDDRETFLRNIEDPDSCGMKWLWGIYCPSYTRISPYGFGMYAAYLHLR